MNTFKTYTTDTIQLKSGLCMPSITLAYETHGTLSPKKDNVILVHHGLSASSHIASTNLNPKKGWWEEIVGSGKALDTNEYYIICVNFFGSCNGSTGAATTNPETGKPYGQTFPNYSVEDMITIEKHVLNALGIEELYAIVGVSFGGMLSLAYGVHFPGVAKKILLISSTHKAYPTNIAVREIQSNILDLSTAHGDIQKGFEISRRINILSYRTSIEMDRRFTGDMTYNEHGEKIEPTLKSYLDYNASKFVKSFDVECYKSLLRVMDEFHIREDELEKLESSVYILSVSSDKLYPSYQQEDLFNLLSDLNKDVYHETIDSIYGHDTFLIDSTQVDSFLTASLKSNSMYHLADNM